MNPHRGSRSEGKIAFYVRKHFTRVRTSFLEISQLCVQSGSHVQFNRKLKTAPDRNRALCHRCGNLRTVAAGYSPWPDLYGSKDDKSIPAVGAAPSHRSARHAESAPGTAYLRDVSGGPGAAFRGIAQTRQRLHLGAGRRSPHELSTVFTSGQIGYFPRRRSVRKGVRLQGRLYTRRSWPCQIPQCWIAARQSRHIARGRETPSCRS